MITQCHLRLDDFHSFAPNWKRKDPNRNWYQSGSFQGCSWARLGPRCGMGLKRQAHQAFLNHGKGGDRWLLKVVKIFTQSRIVLKIVTARQWMQSATAGSSTTESKRSGHKGDSCSESSPSSELIHVPIHSPANACV